MSITVKFTVNGHSAEVTAESGDALGPQVDAAVKALQSVPYNVNAAIKVLPSPTPYYPPGYMLYKDVVACDISQDLVWP